MKTSLIEAVNEQIRNEFQSAYLYLSMSAWFTHKNLPGFAHWMKIQWEEETGHALKLFQFVHDRGGIVTLMPLEAPAIEYDSPTALFEEVLNHEQQVTAEINDLHDLAVKERDLPLQIILQWYITEQVEEEAQVEEILGKLKYLGADGPSLYLLDRNLATRTVPGRG
ncbi:MAG: ferritin [Ignavibacteria bacterium]|nr:ferritin [Ignavibacteria bacterium]